MTLMFVFHAAAVAVFFAAIAVAILSNVEQQVYCGIYVDRLGRRYHVKTVDNVTDIIDYNVVFTSATTNVQTYENCKCSRRRFIEMGLVKLAE